MTTAKKLFSLMIVFVCLAVLAGCTKYERKVVPFKMPQGTSNAVSFNGALISARSFINSDEAKAAFGFDIRSAGILPVQVVFDNKSKYSLMIIPDQTFLIDEESNAWPILDQSMAYDRISRATQLGNVAPEAAKGALLMGAAGAVIGAAVGIVTGTNVGEAVGKGAAIGGAAGLVTGGANGMEEHYEDVQPNIKDDLQSRSLQYRAIRPGELAYGFIFYPGEIKSVKVLRLQLKAKDTGEISTFDMKL